MLLPRFHYERPKDLDEVLALLRERGHEARVLAGGTDLLVGMKQRLYAPALVVDLGGLDELRYVRAGDGDIALEVGPLATLAGLAGNPLVRARFPVLAAAAGTVGAVQHQEMGTVGGNLCLDTRCWYYNQSERWRRSRPPCLKTGGEVCHVVAKSDRCYAVFSGDLAPALIALDARVRLRSATGERELPLAEFYQDDGQRPTDLRPGELVTSVALPAGAEAWQATYRKFRLRASIDFALAGVAVAVRREEGTLADARVVLNAVASAPVQVHEAEGMLRGARVGEQGLARELAVEVVEATVRAARPVRNLASSPGYRREMVKVLVEEALTELLTQVRWPNEPRKGAEG